MRNITFSTYSPSLKYSLKYHHAYHYISDFFLSTPQVALINDVYDFLDTLDATDLGELTLFGLPGGLLGVEGMLLKNSIILVFEVDRKLITSLKIIFSILILSILIIIVPGGN